jgi:hypothetical protein
MVHRPDRVHHNSEASDHDRAEPNSDKETEQHTIGQRNRSHAEHRRLQALQRLKFISLKTRNGKRTAQHIVSQEGYTLAHAGQRLRESMDAVRVRTVLAKDGDIHRECAPDFEERRRASELVLRLHECLRGPNARIEEPDVFAANTKVDPLLEHFKKMDNVDQNLWLQATDVVIQLITGGMEIICKERYSLTLKELEAQLHEEAVRMCFGQNYSPVSEGPLEEASAEGRDSSGEVRNGS